jgi:3',5'-cyclic AMP phosphodiesterase CpdA
MRIAHLSDIHLTTGPLAAGPAEGLAGAIGRLLRIEPLPDCVVVTGDLTDNGRPDEYAALHTILGRCPVPVHLATGNRDNPTNLVAQFGGTRFLGGGKTTSYVVEYPDATVIVADSHVLGSAAGRLGVDQLDWLDRVLAGRAGVPTFVCLHHPPVPVGIPYLDGIRLADGARLAEVVARHPHVVRILAGHARRTISAPFAGSIVTVAPSTYRQTALHLHDATPPGYLAEPTGFLLHLLDGQTCVTHSVAVSHASAVYAF